jgi:hypothetical protein
MTLIVRLSPHFDTPAVESLVWAMASRRQALSPVFTLVWHPCLPALTGLGEDAYNKFGIKSCARVLAR